MGRIICFWPSEHAQRDFFQMSSDWRISRYSRLIPPDPARWNRFAILHGMLRIDGAQVKEVKPYFKVASRVAKKATCRRANCGAIIVKNDVMLGQGYNGPPLGASGNRTCETVLEVGIKPKHDKTCCIHAEWRAILDACKKHGDEVSGSRLYFMRVDENGNFTNAGKPCCTVCSRLTMDAGIAEFAIWNNDGADVYSAAEYDKLCYEFYAPSGDSGNVMKNT